MRILQLVLLLMLPLITAGQQARTSTTYRIGNAVQECRGRGLCDLSWTNDESAKSYLGKVSSNRITLTIDRNSLTETEQINIAGKLFKDIKANETVYFIQAHDLNIAPQTLNTLKVNSDNSILAAGNYPLRITPEFIEVTFTLSSKD